MSLRAVATFNELRLVARIVASPEAVGGNRAAINSHCRSSQLEPVAVAVFAPPSVAEVGAELPSSLASDCSKLAVGCILPLRMRQTRARRCAGAAYLSERRTAAAWFRIGSVGDQWSARPPTWRQDHPVERFASVPSVSQDVPERVCTHRYAMAPFNSNRDAVGTQSERRRGRYRDPSCRPRQWRQPLGRSSCHRCIVGRRSARI